MSIEKSLYQAPAGLDELQKEPDIEIEVEDPEAIRISADGEELLDIEKTDLEDEFNENLVEVLPASVVQQLAGEIGKAHV